MALKAAEKRGHVPRNVAMLVAKPSAKEIESHKARVFLEAEQSRLLLKNAQTSKYYRLYISQSVAAQELGDFASAATNYAEAADLFRKLGDDTGLAWAVYGQGFAARELGDSASAAALCGEAADLFRKLGDDEGAALTRELQAELARQLAGQN